ncbi:hypothetical protein ACH3O9_10445 [Leeuwenhoekiella sp. A16]|uniref:hypothetical protein n=1 Tax=unclassified Leeuwenhoekiella TaxID=2615029 RepID=UPI003A7FD7A8
MLKRIGVKALIILYVLLQTGCVRDIDLDQADEFATEQDVDLDLIYFTLDAQNFTDETGAIIEPATTQETRVELFDDEFFQENLEELGLYVRIENTFFQGFITTLNFLDEEGNITYSVQINVTGSTNDQPVTTIYDEVITGEDLDLIRASISISIATEIIPDGNPVSGELNFQSKLRYHLTF